MTASPKATGDRRRQRVDGVAPVLNPPSVLRRMLDTATGDHRVALLAVFAIAATIRLAPLLRTGSLTGVLGDDDGSSYSASAHLLRGLLPYRDVAFDQMPGIAVLLLPFTVTALWAGDQVGLATVRIAAVLLGALNAVLIAVFLRRYAPAYALAGGLLYAVWRLPAAAERTAYPEVFGACGLMLALLLLGTGAGLPPRRVAASGAVMGGAAAVALWIVPAVAMGGIFLLAGRSVRTAVVWLGSALGGFAVLAVPFIIAAPATFVRQAVHDQMLSGSPPTTTERFQRFADLARLGDYDIPAEIEVMVATCVIVGVAAASFSAWWQPEARLVALITPLLCLVVAATPDYRYGSFAIAPTLVIVLITAVHRLALPPWSRPASVAITAVMALGLGGLALSAVHDVVPRPSNLDRLRAFASGSGCVWFETASAAITADALSGQLARGCPVPVDRLADFRFQARTYSDTALDAAQDDEQFQQRLSAELETATSAVISTDNDEGILGGDAREDLTDRFRSVAMYDDVTFWVLRR